MKAHYKHTNIVSSNWRSLAKFYQEVFGCVPIPPERHLSGKWLDIGTGIDGARLSGIHLRLPGHGDRGPTLEIFQYAQNEPKPPCVANRQGIGHLAFEVNDVREAMSEVLRHGGTQVGDIASAEVKGVGQLCFVYLADPEGNIIELQAWK